MNGDCLSFEQHGAARYDRAALGGLTALEAALTHLDGQRAGVRLHGLPTLGALLGPGSAMASLSASYLGVDAKPVRAILFDKSRQTNWALGWHQDRTVAVRAAADLPHWGPWSRKAGIPHVEPPFEVIERMITLRVHFDRVPRDNAPLLIAPGSHRLGRIPEPDIESVVRECGTATCLAERGDVWVYATPVLHALAASTGHAHRRVLQVDYSNATLPPPLEWLGI